MAYTTIDDPSAYFQTTLFTGNDSARDITNTGNSDLQPDWIWLKGRSHGYNHGLFDSSRGVQKELQINTTSAENTLTAGVSAFNSNGFSFNGANYNTNAYTFVAWQWKVNGGSTTSFSESGSQIGGTRQVNTTAGISLITYTGNGSSGSTIPHGLSQTPEYVMVKNRGDADEWVANGSVLGNYARLHPNSQSSLATGEGSHDYIKYPDTNSTNLVTGVSHNRSNADGDTYMAWCFHSVQGYSKIGTYTGNGSTNGPFIHTGFAPAWIMFKRIDGGTQNWFILDNKRDDGINPRNSYLMPNSSSAEDPNNSTVDTDFLSNGFKLRATTGALNGNGETFFYMAFAESPFVSSEGVPTTAR